jgi:hypothetical protein
MKVLKADLPEGVRKKFVVRIGKKIKLINKKYAGKKNKVSK